MGQRQPSSGHGNQGGAQPFQVYWQQIFLLPEALAHGTKSKNGGDTVPELPRTNPGWFCGTAGWGFMVPDDYWKSSPKEQLNSFLQYTAHSKVW